MSEIYGVFDEIEYRNEKTGNTTFSVITSSFPKYSFNNKLKCTGNLPLFPAKTPLKLNGDIEEISKGKYVFSATSVIPFIYNEKMAITYLSNYDIKGLGQKTAERIISVIGTDIFSYAKDTSLLPSLISKLSPKDYDLFSTFIDKIKIIFQQDEVYNYLSEYEGNYFQASVISNNYKNALEVLKSNPYEVGLSVNLPFLMCEKIYKREGGKPFSNIRMEALVTIALKSIENQGSTFGTLNDIVSWINKYSSRSVFNVEIPSVLVLNTVRKMKNVICEDKEGLLRIYFKYTYNQEKNIVHHLRRLMNVSIKYPFDSSFVDKIESLNNIKYETNQRKAFDFLSSSGVKVLTGGPGTGKTTVINGLIQAYKMMFPQNKILLCAPTGRAAQRMSEATNRKALTIHKALDVLPYENGEITSRTLDNPLDADFIIVDEMSMTDTIICSALLGAIKNNSLVLLCGDIDQLPSVGAGNILSDIINSELAQVVTLDVIKRQASGSIITSNAITVNKGSSYIKTNSNFEIKKFETEKDMLSAICNISKNIYSSKNPFSVQILCSAKKGEAGVYNLNRQIQTLVNPNEEKIQYDYFSYRVGDKIMMIKNNYDEGYVNGDIGIITEIEERSFTVNLLGVGELILSKSLLCDMTLAYASTIHKSQGSEYDTVIISLPKNPTNMLKRNLLYTAITRAKKNVIIITQNGVLDFTVKRCDTVNRNTSVLDKLISSENIIF